MSGAPPAAHRAPRSRRGAALIIAIVILAALLMLGVPFLFTQSSSLMGTRSFAHGQTSSIGRDAAENLGIAAGAQVVKTYFIGTTGSTGTEQWTSISAKLVNAQGQLPNPPSPPAWAVQLGDNRVGLDLSKMPGFNGNPPLDAGVPAPAVGAPTGVANGPVIGTAIEDEAGKLDPNSLSVAGWDALFKQVGIDDWDDNATTNSKAYFNNAKRMWYQFTDDDGYGELARAMAEVRLNLPGRRILHLEDLLQADTGHWNGVGGAYSYPSASPPPQKFGLRRPLTRSELELLRPYLTLHNPSPGRGSADPTKPPPAFGLGKEAIIDLGTVIGADAPSATVGAWTYFVDGPAVNTFDQAAPVMVANTQPMLVGMGTWVITDQLDAVGPNRGIVSGTNNANNGWVSAGLNIQATSDLTQSSSALYSNPSPDSPARQGMSSVCLAIEAPPTVNINDAPQAVRGVFGLLQRPAATVTTQDALKQLQPSSLTLVGQMLSAFNLQDPLGSSYMTNNAADKRLVELPPLGIASPGIITVTSAATTLDAQGHQGAQEIRRAVVQAIPQEQVVEHRWITQGHFNGLIMHRYTSQLEAWPNPYRRLLMNPADALTTPDDPDLSAGGSPANLTGLRPAVQPNESTGYTNRTSAIIQPGFAPPLPIAGSTYVFGQGMPQYFLYDPNFSIDWRMPLGGDIAVAPAALFNEVVSGTSALAVGAGAYTENDLRPDGLLLKAGAPLAVQLTDDGPASGHGLLRRTSFTLPPPVALQGWEINGRHVSFWITPQSDWANGITPLLEARIPAGHAGTPLVDGAQGGGAAGGAGAGGGAGAAAGGNGDLQNYLGLFYDRTKQMVVLVFAPPAIEHLTDYGLSIPADDTTTTFDLDERCLGNDAAVGTLAPLAPMQVPDATPGGTSPRLSSLTTLFRPNRIVHCFKVPDRGGKPYFHQGQSVHIQLALAKDSPGSSAIIIDGCVGRDVGRDQAAAGMLTLFGDHCTLPALTLATAIPFTDITTAFGAGLQLPSITVNPVAGLNAQDLFPARGMIKIDDEYFTYQSITGNTFTNCVRAQRQNTVTFGAAPIQRWPVTEAHSQGAYVTPGGYRLTIGLPTVVINQPKGGVRPRWLYTGSETLANPLYNGDPNPTSGPLQWHIWGRIDATKVPPLVVDPNDPTGQTLDLFPNAPVTTNIPLDPAQGVMSLAPQQFPPRGVVLINGQYLAYSGIANNALTGVTPITGWTFAPGANPGQPITEITFNKNNPPIVTLISMEVTGNDPTMLGSFSQGGFRPGGDMYIQVKHATSGRVEWIQYNQIANASASGMGYYFLNLNDGFSFNNRGQQRTDFVGRPTVNPAMHTTLQPTSIFPAGSLVLPVQVEIAPAGHIVATGDVITILPKAQFTGTSPYAPQQAVVRFAAMDGYDVVDSKNPNNDTYNELFAFNDPLPIAYNQLDAQQLEFLSWPGWSGNDLTNPVNGPLSPLGSPHGYLPRIDDLADGYQPPARTFLAAVDAQHGGAQAGISLTADASIDAIVAGPLPASNATTVGTIAAWVSSSSVFNGSDSAPLPNGIDATVGTMAGAKVRTVEPIFMTPMGLVLIGGEVFAFDRDSNPTGARTTEALLVGRGLLGSTCIPHSGQEYFTILPIGPVARLDGALPNQGFFQLYDAQPQGQGNRRWVTFDAPVAMFLDPAGSSGGAQAAQELIQLIGPRWQTNPPNTPNSPAVPWYITAPWLRGLYNTVQGSWGPGASGLAPIVVGWWPRYASALPSTGVTTQHYRSRTYAWAGFPLSLNDARFDPATFGSDPVASVSVLDSQTSTEFQLEAHAMATGFDWATSPAAQLSNSASADQDVSSAFNYAQFSNTSVNGAELRVLWRYLTPASSKLDDIAQASNSAPTLGPVRIRALAPAKVLSIEGAR